jgi:hypothetical protein
MISRKLIVAIVLVLGGIALATEMTTDSINERLLPRSRPAIRDVHPVHRTAEVDCVVCHPKALASAWASERLIPPLALCSKCHREAVESEPGTQVSAVCGKCHLLPSKESRPRMGQYPRPNIRFSLKAHYDNQTPCRICHPSAASDQERGPTGDVIGMRECYECHRKSACRTCHLAYADGRMVTEFSGEKLYPPDWLRGASHGTEWAGSHAVIAGSDSRYCASCHRDTFCRDCHSGKVRPRKIHPGDWLASHGVTTRLDNPRCRGCHRKQSFCITCHRRSGVAPDSPEKTRPLGGAGRYHGKMETRDLMRRARHDVTTCVSCHTEGSCKTCHVRIKPHPPGFRNKCKPLARRNPRACGKCHQDDAPKRCN